MAICSENCIVGKAKECTNKVCCIQNVDFDINSIIRAQLQHGM